MTAFFSAWQIPSHLLAQLKCLFLSGSASIALPFSLLPKAYTPFMTLNYIIQHNNA
jgi:hypothetical protein